MGGWSRLVAGAVAGLCLVGAPGFVPGAAAHSRPAPAIPIRCGTVDLSSWELGTHLLITAKLGSTEATLDGTVVEEWGMRALGSPQLTIRHDGATVRSGSILDLPSLENPPEPAGVAKAIQPDSIQPVKPSPDGKSYPVHPLCVAHLAGNDQPTVLLGLYSGGAHCCTVLRAYPLEGSGSDDGVNLETWNSGVDVERDPHGKGAVVFTSDSAFDYEFAPYAASGAPIRLFTFRGAEFADITRTYPNLVRHDAARWWKSFSGDPSQGLGMLAAWVGDQCLLGKDKHAWATIDRLLAEGKLAGNPDDQGMWPTGTVYVTALRSFLSENGYCR